MQITLFRGEYGFLSNFYDAMVEFDGLVYRNSEAAYQAQKTDNFEDRFPFRYYTGKEAKAAAYKVSRRSDWDEVKIYLMYDICKAKFSQNKHLREKLIQTHPHELIEGNDRKDTFWGVYNGVGSNYLGRILMIIREEFILEDSEDVSDTYEDLIAHDGY